MAKQLSVDTVQPVRYCIPTWLRDEQVKLALQRPVGRIGDRLTPRDESCAVVCYGPSLNDTWEQIRDFPFIFSCSGSHKFLLERGIVPTWHVEVDPRAHKVDLMGPPHSDVEYLIASACHPKLFDHLDGFKVKLWHIFSTEAEVIRLLPRGEWAVTGGCSVGLRAMTLARFLGFTQQHIFGMDGCFGASGKHAAAHPNQPADYAEVDYEGKTYQTTPSVLECARQTWHELNQMPDVKATFHGEGLVQHMAQFYVPKPVPEALAAIALNKPPVISPDYLALNKQLHRDNLAYGIGGEKHAPTVLKLVETMKTRSVLDYGCGKGYLAKAIPFPIWEYDPAIAGKDEPPRPADLVVCTDVLEHIEPEHLIAVLDDLRRCTLKVGYFVIYTEPAQKTLADGRNAHLIQKSRSWWQKQLERFFYVGKITKAGPLLICVVGPKPRPASARRASVAISVPSSRPEATA